jgi:hypothetical protein
MLGSHRPHPPPGGFVPHRRLLALVALLLLATGLAGGGLLAAPVSAADPPTLNAHVLLGAHARVGAWMGIAVEIRNDGPQVVGELRLEAGSQGHTRYGMPVDLPTQSDKTFVLYAQPPTFGGQLQVQLISNDQSIATRNVDFTIHDAGQLVVGVIAEKPQGIVPRIDLLPSIAGQDAAIVQLTPAELPDRTEGWASVDRLIWQDVDTSSLRPEQISALRGWLAAGGRLVLAGGTAGVGVFSGFPDDILPYRPTATVDVAPDSITGLLGEKPAGATDLPALSGDLMRGTTLATSGDRVIAAEAGYGSGAVTLLGFDPGTRWIVDSPAVKALWRRVVPPLSNGALAIGNDNQLVGAVGQQPALALPPIGGLLALLFGYILLIGPINYLVLRRLDRREWAWVTMPVLIAIFAVGAYAFGAALRGLDVIVNEVAIVRGAPDATEGSAQVYLGVFSPSRGTYQIEVPGGALLSSTLSGEFIGGGNNQLLDVLQGDPARIRDLAIGFGSLRTVRAETAATVPRVHADLGLVDGSLRGTVRNDSDQVLERAAVVLGDSVVLLDDIAPGQERTVSGTVGANRVGASVADWIFGPAFLGDPTSTSEGYQRAVVRRAMIDQLTIDPVTSVNTGLSAETPVLLAWGTRTVVDLRISGQTPRRTGNVLYYIPLAMRVRGHVSFQGDLIRATPIEDNQGMFNKDPSAINMGRGHLTMAFRPITFDGALAATRVILAPNFGGTSRDLGNTGKPIAPVDHQPCRDESSDPPDCQQTPPPEPCDSTTKDCFIQDVPAVELFDRRGNGTWLRLEKLEAGQTYEVEHPERYVDPGSGTLLVRFVNDSEEASFQFDVRIEGDVR